MNQLDWERSKDVVIVNATDMFINSGEEASHVRSDISFPDKPYTVKVGTESGNIAVHSGN